jgi:hypothetical protein
MRVGDFFRGAVASGVSGGDAAAAAAVGFDRGVGAGEDRAIERSLGVFRFRFRCLRFRVLVISEYTVLSE